MDTQHPLDGELRAKLRAMGPNQSELARQIGRQASWLNKYMHGAGHATIDDVVRILAVLSGAGTGGLSESETRLLKAWRDLPDDDRREDAIASIQAVARGARRPPPKSFEPAVHTTPATKHTKHGRR